MLEVEVKVKTDTATIVPRLLEMGFVQGTSEYERDSYFNGEKIDLKAEDKALRIRESRSCAPDSLERAPGSAGHALYYPPDTVQGQNSSCSRYVMNYKGPKIDNSTMTRAETEFEIPSFEAGKNMLSGLGFHIAGVVEKTRVHYMKDEITCCLDTVTDLGEFLEIEIIAEEAEYENAMLRISDLLLKLGLSMEDTVRESYLCMLQDKN